MQNIIPSTTKPTIQLLNMFWPFGYRTYPVTECLLYKLSWIDLFLKCNNITMK